MRESKFKKLRGFTRRLDRRRPHRLVRTEQFGRVLSAFGAVTTQHAAGRAIAVAAQHVRSGAAGWRESVCGS